MFVCLLSTDGSRVTDVERGRYASRIRVLAGASAVGSDKTETVDAGEFVAFAAPALVPLRPLCGRRHGLTGVGNVRLDHRTVVQQWSSAAGSGLSDLDLVLDAIDARGTNCLRDALGDFALVVWNPRIRTLTAARDAFGVKTLFVGHRGRLLVLSSHLELVHDTDTLDEEYVADFLLAGDPGPVRTIWADSQAVAQGSILTSRDGKLSSERFWSPYDFEPVANSDERAQVEQFRWLFHEAVRTRLEPNGRTWAELSGGLDSSSVVSTAQALVEAGTVPESVAGTISIVDELGSGNERRFSDLLVQRFNLPNTIVTNPWPWQDDGRGPPCTDEPRTHYPFFARDRLICDTVRSAGARVLLSGMGSDHYLYGNRLFIADLFARGHVIRGGVEATRWAILEKRSFWSSVAQDAVLPLMPAALQLRCLQQRLRVPDWIEPSFARRFRLNGRLRALRASQAPAGLKCHRQICRYVQELTRWLPRASFEEGLELRYPFLYRPLVELGLQLPPVMRARPRAPKWILREAMRGILPEAIRNRPGKGGIDSRLAWGFRRERPVISKVLTGATLPRLGIVDVRKLDAAVDQATRGEIVALPQLLAALSLETWLLARCGGFLGQQAVAPAGLVVHRSKNVLSA